MHTPDDIRYMSHEVRIAEGYMKAPTAAETRRRDAEARIKSYGPAMTEAKARGYAARKAGDAEAYAKAVADIRFYRERMAEAEEATR